MTDQVAQPAENADVRAGLEAAVERAKEIVAEGYAEPEDPDVVNIAECLLAAREALREIVSQFTLWSEDANDGEFAYYRSDGLMAACVAARTYLAGVSS